MFRGYQFNFYAQNAAWMVGSGSRFVPKDLVVFPSHSIWVGNVMRSRKRPMVREGGGL